ncbi:unnamed protein product [Rhizoctonia solani]|uniref:Peptidase C14 caspase domain-containing protein n=1 Tax=Rhizoctonia solani TaxID=456999 RepID=A0A8H2Y3Y5_9AGAM|nr:unnamed protein product [Rhizoctonia solani]
MTWPNSGCSMVLNGAVQDRIHIRRFLDKYRLTLRVKVKVVDNASRKSIEDHNRKAVDSCPPLLIAYFQGHGLPHSDNVKFITSDEREDGTLEGLTAEELVEMSSKLTTQTKSVVITDFCFSGNVYRLKFYLQVEQDGSGSWHLTEGWSEEITSPMGRNRSTKPPGWGAMLPKWSLADLKTALITLPQILLHLRRRVDYHLGAAKVHPKGRVTFKDAKQVPQIYSNYMWPLDDLRILLKFGLEETIPISD